MKRKKRIPKIIGLRPSDLRSNASSVLRRHGWGKKDGKPEAFDVPMLCEWLNLDSNNVYNRNKVYQKIICYWRKHFVPNFKFWLQAGDIEEGDRFERWETALWNYNQNDAYVFFSRREKGEPPYFIQPSFEEIERMDHKRLDKKMKGIVTILNEMKQFDAKLLRTDKTVTEMLEDGKKYAKVYLNNRWDKDDSTD